MPQRLAAAAAVHTQQQRIAAAAADMPAAAAADTRAAVVVDATNPQLLVPSAIGITSGGALELRRFAFTLPRNASSIMAR